MFSRRLFLSSVRSILQLESKALACQAVFSTRTTQFRMASSLPPLPIFSALASHESSSTAVVHSASGRSFTYGQLLQDVATAKDKLKLDAGSKSLEGERIAFLVENSYDYVVTLLSIFGVNAIALPLSAPFPANELKYIMDQSQASMLLSSKKFRKKSEEVLATGLEGSPKHIMLEKIMSSESVEKVELSGESEGKAGMMLYTSGTTNRPKGVLLPLPALTAQAQSLLKAWAYSSEDRLLHVLPLHHIHGTINAVLTPLFAGSTIEFLFPFNATNVWNRLAAPFLDTPEQNGSKTNGSHAKAKPITFFTVVPTVYNRLLSTQSDLSPELLAATKKAISPDNLRLNISGSAALPTPTKKKWTDLSSGNILLERYGMTEVGMALSCGLGWDTRVDGSVGWPLPGVEARLVDTDTNEVIKPGQETGTDGRERDGEIQLSGATIFKEYWRNPKATNSEFITDEQSGKKWFKTGDVAVRREVPSALEGLSESDKSWCKGPMYFIRGRLSADIIKTGGEKVSALEVEREILSLPEISEAAVCAVGSGKWGQKVGVVLVLKSGVKGAKGGDWTTMDLRRNLKDRLANYKIPQVMRVVDEIPKNAMGKVSKKQLVKDVFADDVSGDEV